MVKGYKIISVGWGIIGKGRMEKSNSLFLFAHYDTKREMFEI